MALDVEEDEHDDEVDSQSEEEDSDYSASDAEEETSDHEQAGPSGEQDWHNLFMGLWPAHTSQLILVCVVWQLQVAIQLTKLAFK